MLKVNHQGYCYIQSFIPIILFLVGSMVMIYAQNVVVPEVQVIPNQCTDGRFVVKSPEEDANQLHQTLLQW